MDGGGGKKRGSTTSKMRTRRINGLNFVRGDEKQGPNNLFVD